MATPASSFLQTEVPLQTDIAFSVGPSSQRPVSPTDGYVYSDTTLGVIARWNGTLWVTIGATASLPFSAGSSGNYPVAPTFPYLYWNTTTQQLNLWNGTTWVIIGPIAAPAPPSIAAPQITTQPAGQTVAPTANVTFTVNATGVGVLTYQWYFNGVVIAGATSASYNIPSAAQTNGGTFSVTVTGSGGTTTSLGAVLVVTGNPFVISQPASQTVNAGASCSFTVLATGTAPLTYQWYLNSVAVTGATAATYSIGNVQSANAGSYTCTVTNGLSSTTTSAATLAVLATPYRGSWTSFNGIALISSTADVYYGFVLNGTSGGSSVVTFQFTSASGAFPPGVSYAIYNSAGAIVTSATSVGGETALSTSFTVAPTLQATASYSVVTAYNSNLVVSGTVSVSGAATFINSSIRATVVGSVLAPPDGFAMQLQVTSVTASSLVNMSFYEAVTHVYRAAPFSWNFNSSGLTSVNPLYNQSVSNTVTMLGYAPASGTGDSLLELNAVQ